MENKFTRFVYDHSPPFFQDLYATVYGYSKLRARYCRDYRYWYDFYRQSRSWSLPRLQEYQRQQLRYIIRHAYQTTLFYRQRLDKLGLSPDDIREVEDLPKLPLLEKDEIRLHGNRMISSKYPRRSIITSSTGGTTGMPLTIYTPKQVLPRHYGFHSARWRPSTVQQGQPYASFGGPLIVCPHRTKPPFWRRNYAARQTCYSVFHLRPEFIIHYVKDLNSRPFQWWEGYPSAMYILASYIEQSGVDFTNYPKAVLPTSEEVLPVYRDTLTRVLHTRVWDSYGQCEMAASITEYPCGHYHYDMDYSILEWIPRGREDGEQLYEIVCTGFINDGWPMIRYRIGDLCVLDPDVSCDYHAGPVVKRIHGRTGHMIYTPDGHTISNVTVIARNCRNIRGLQLVQKKLDTVTLRIIRAENFQPEDEGDVLKQFRLRYGDKVNYQIEYVDQLERTKAGKTLSIISRLSPEDKARAQNLVAGADPISS